MTTTGSARQRGRPPKSESGGREALLRGAIEAFARHGFDRADLRGIAARAGVAPNLVRIHFGDKAGLWSACVDRMAQDMRPGLEAVADLVMDDRPLAARLRMGVSVMSAFYDTYPAVRDFVLGIPSENPERAAHIARKLLIPAWEAGQPLIAAGIEAGIIRATHPALVFVLLNSALSQPPQFPELLTLLATDIAPEEARARLLETVLSVLIHDPAAEPATEFSPGADGGQA
jgi:AcrR family transcriptional regulator